MDSIGSINSGSSSPIQSTSRTPEAREVKGVRDNDGDADDGGAKAVKSIPSATVNAAGEKIGKVINTAA